MLNVMLFDWQVGPAVVVVVVVVVPVVAKMPSSTLQLIQASEPKYMGQVSSSSSSSR